MDAINIPQQGTQEWMQQRVGLATASRFKDILATVKSGESASRRNYRAQLVCERLTGAPSESFASPAMQWGTEQEGFARMAYESRTGEIVEEVGFIRHATLMAGASPDGLVGDDGMTEFKCPNTATHIDTLLGGMPKDHLPQVMGQMWICGRKWVDFVSFDPRLPENMQLHIQRIPRDEAYIDKLVIQVETFLAEVEQTIIQLQKKAA